MAAPPVNSPGLSFATSRIIRRRGSVVDRAVNWRRATSWRGVPQEDSILVEPDPDALPEPQVITPNWFCAY